MLPELLCIVELRLRLCLAPSRCHLEGGERQITGSEYIDQFEDVQYEPLPLPASIQLLRLVSGIDQQPIHCKLQVADLIGFCAHHQVSISCGGTG